MEIDAANYFKFLLSLLFVLGLIGGFALFAKRLGLGNRGPVKRKKGKRLSIIETITLDAKRRMVLVRRDDAEHLILIGSTSEQVIETGFAAPRGDQEAPGADAIQLHSHVKRSEAVG